jgi:hypothetical protein
MNFLSKKTAPEPIISLPNTREVSIVGHIWPAERSSYRDLRFHFHGKNPMLEVDAVKDLLCKYVKSVDVNPVSFHTQCIIEAALVPLIQQKLSELGLHIKWIVVKL